MNKKIFHKIRIEWNTISVVPFVVSCLPDETGFSPLLLKGRGALLNHNASTSLVLILLFLATMVLLHLLLLIILLAATMIILLAATTVIVATSVLLMTSMLLLSLADRWGVRIVATIPVLGQQNTADSFVDGFQLRQVGGRDFDGVAGHGKHNNVLPWMDLVLILDHLRTLPIILDTGALQRELLHFDRHRSSGLRLNDSNIIFGLKKIK